jgi:hypothetical protein
MNTPQSRSEVRTVPNMVWFLLAAWALIFAKCAVVFWAIGRWHVPFHANWVIIPTLLTAVLAIGLWLALREK